MEDLINDLLECTKKSKKNLLILKKAAILCNQKALLDKLIEIENELYPETEEDKKAKESAVKLTILFNSVGLDISTPAAWIIYESMRVYSKKKGRFTILDAEKIKAKQVELFNL